MSLPRIELGSLRSMGLGSLRSMELGSLRSMELGSLRSTVERFEGRRIAVLGDCMLDRYLWGRVERISPEAPVPVVEIERESLALGGAGNVAANLRMLGAEPVLIGVIGDDADAERLAHALRERGLSIAGVVRDAT